MDNAELINYIIERIPNPSLRDQARIQRFNSTTELLRAFEKVTLQTKGQLNDAVQSESRGFGPRKEEKTIDCEKCYN